MKIKYTVIGIITTLFMLELSGCSIPPYPDGYSVPPYPDPIGNLLQTIEANYLYGANQCCPPPVEPPPAEEPPPEEEPPVFGNLTCGDPFVVPTAVVKRDLEHKPPLNIANLPKPVNPLLVNSKRVIGFTFTDGQIALMASPVQARCWFDQAPFTPVGVVWSWEQENNPDTPMTHVVAIDRNPNEEGYAKGILIPLDETVVSPDQFTNLSQEVTPVRFKAVQLQPENDATFSKMPPVDVSIRANSVCFRYGDMLYCSQNEYLLSPKYLFSGKYDEQVKEKIDKAWDKVTTDDLPEANILADMAVSEIEQPERIKKCRPSEPHDSELGNDCEADIIITAIGPVMVNIDKPPAVGLVVVAQDLNYAPDRKSRLDSDEKNSQYLPEGSYLITPYVGYRRERESVPVFKISNNKPEYTADIPAKPRRYSVVSKEYTEQWFMEISGICSYDACYWWESDDGWWESDDDDYDGWE